VSETTPQRTPQERDALDEVTNAALALYDHARTFVGDGRDSTDVVTSRVAQSLDETPEGRALLVRVLEAARRCRLGGVRP
jgi:hypothetical protein